MKAVYIKEFGGPENLEMREVPDPPRPQNTHALVRVKAAGLNRADLLQRRGLYPPPVGYSPNIPGLEFAGDIAEIGRDVKQLRVGDRVFGITAGDAQAEFLLTDESALVKIPSNLSYTDAAAIPEAFITAHDAIVIQAGVRSGETLLVHAVGSGVGLAALQIGKTIGAKVFGTSRTSDKLEQCKAFGLDEAILTGGETSFGEIIAEKTGGKGVDVILDLVGASYFQDNLASLALKGRLMLVGMTGGSNTDFNLGPVLYKRLTIKGTVLRARSIAEKAEATSAFAADVLPWLENGKVKPNVDKVFKVEDVRAAHAYLESNANFGKVILEF